MPQAFRDPTPGWLKDPSVVTGRQPGQANVVEPAVYKALRMLAGLIGADDPESQVMGLATTGVPVKNALRQVAEAVAPKKGIRAFHGSPHDFDKFSSANIGTGEGAQAYGHGLYFAEKEATARAYRDNLSSKVVPAFGGKPVSTSAESIAHDILSKYDSVTAPKVLEEYIKGGIFRGPNEARAIDEARRALAANLDSVADTAQQVSGKMYEVNINADPEHFLDWDAPLSQQSPQVRASLQKEWLAHPEADAARTGEQIYRTTVESPTLRDEASFNRGPKGAAEALKRAGIPGIKYLDQGSRAAGEGSRNYVAFDDQIIDIMRKYGLLPAAVGAGTGQALSQPETR